MDIVSRLKIFMNHTGLPTTQFADEANIPRPTISQILNGRNRKISNEVIAKLHEGFPSLNILWLLFGDGDMEVASAPSYSKQGNAPSPNDGFQSMPKSINTFPVGSRNIPTDKSSLGKEPNDISENDDNPIPNFLNEEDETEPSPSDAPFNKFDHINANDKRKVSYVMVFYNDNSYEVLKPERP